MQKRMFGSVLTMALCFGLAIPASAAGASSLTPGEAASYYQVLNREPHFCSLLEDLNLDGKPELMLFDTVEPSDSMFELLNLTVWTIRNGSAVETMSQSISAHAGSALNSVGIARQAGATRIFVSDSNPPMNRATCYFYDMNGAVKTYQGEMDLAGTAAVDSLYEELEQDWKMEYLFQGEGGYWYGEENTSSDVSGDLYHRMEQTGTSNADNTYTVTGYEIDGSRYTIMFEVTSVEKKTLMVIDADDATASDREPVEATLVSVRPDSIIQITGGTTVAEDWIHGSEPGVRATAGHMEGLNCSMAGALPANLCNGPASKNFPNGSEVYRLNGTDGDGDPIYVRMGKATATVGGFSDVKEDAYYADAVAWAVEKGITTGTLATTFSPEATCTTGQIMTLLWRASGSPVVSGVTPFSDVSPSDYFYQASLWAKKQGLLSGTAFRGNTPCTRAATVTYLWKMAGQPSGGTAGFTDVPANAEFARAVAWAVQAGVTSGTGNQKFSPEVICTRGQIMTFIYRYMGE